MLPPDLQATLDRIATHGVENGVFMVRGRPMVNVNMFRNLAREALGLATPRFELDPKRMDYGDCAKKVKGHTTLFLVEATECKRSITPLDVFSNFYEACGKAGFSEGDWLNILPLLVVHTDWAYTREKLGITAYSTPLKGGVALLEAEAAHAQALVLRTSNATRRTDIRAAFAAIRAGTKPPVSFSQTPDRS